MALKNKTHDAERLAGIKRTQKQAVRTENEHEQVSTSAGALELIPTKPPAALRPADIMTLQRTVGNRVVQRLLSNQPRSVSSLPFTAAQTIQRQTEEEEPLQRKSDSSIRAEHKTGLPHRLKAGIENLSGLSLDDVRVHRNSLRPAELHARAYTQGTDIHLGPDEEKHLPHEAWHVVQQKQGRVKPTLQGKGLPINDDASLEREADAMGQEAVLRPSALPTVRLDMAASEAHIGRFAPGELNHSKAPVQRKVTQGNKELTYEEVNEWYSKRLETLFQTVPNRRLLERAIKSQVVINLDRVEKEGNPSQALLKSLTALAGFQKGEVKIIENVHKVKLEGNKYITIPEKLLTETLKKSGTEVEVALSEDERTIIRLFPNLPMEKQGASANNDKKDAQKKFEIAEAPETVDAYEMEQPEPKKNYGKEKHSEEKTKEKGEKTGPQESIVVYDDKIDETRIAIYLESHQNKHQYPPIGQLKPYTGEPGSKFPPNVNLAYHKDRISKQLVEWAKTNKKQIIDSADKQGKGTQRVIPGKFEIDPDRINFDVTATYDKVEKKIYISYHCNPSDKATPKDFK